jgi:hypothetical protein
MHENRRFLAVDWGRDQSTDRIRGSIFKGG